MLKIRYVAKEHCRRHVIFYLQVESSNSCYCASTRSPTAAAGAPTKSPAATGALQQQQLVHLRSLQRWQLGRLPKSPTAATSAPMKSPKAATGAPTKSPTVATSALGDGQMELIPGELLPRNYFQQKDFHQCYSTQPPHPLPPRGDAPPPPPQLQRQPQAFLMRF